MKSVWTIPDKPFLGKRDYLRFDELRGKNRKMPSETHGDYKWLTFRQSEEIVDNLSKSLVSRNLCPVIKSNVEGTPDLKFLGIFSENRQEWFITELAACSHSIVTVPLSVESQFLESKRICHVIDCTEMQTLCVSKKTISFILELKQNGQLPYLKSLILFDHADQRMLEWATEQGVELLTFQFLVKEGDKI